MLTFEAEHVVPSCPWGAEDRPAVLSSPRLPAPRGRLRALVLAVLVLATSVLLVLAGPGRASAQLVTVPVGAAVAETAEAVGAAAGTIGLAPALITLGVAAGALYLFASYADHSGPFAPGGLINSLLGKTPNGVSTGGGYYARASSIPSFPNGLSPESVQWTNDCQPGKSATNFCDSYMPGSLPNIYQYSTCLIKSGANIGTTYVVSHATGLSGPQTPCTQNAGDWLLFARSSGKGDDNVATTVGYAFNMAHPEAAAALTMTAVKHCHDGTKTPPDFDVTAIAHGVTQLPNAACPNGSNPTGEEFSIALPDGFTMPLGGITNGTAGLYPLCAAGCAHHIKVDGVACTVGAQLCYSWSSLDPARVECSYGTYVVGLVECDSIKYGYRSTGGLGQDQTSNSTELVPLRKETGLPDPQYGPGTSWAPAPATSTAPAPATTTAPAPAPTATATPGPTVTPTPVPPPGPGDPGTTTTADPRATPDETACFPSGWSAFNPVQWVLMPVKCALTWAFIPPPGVVQGLWAGAGTAWSGSGPGHFFNGIFPVWGAMAGLSTGGCSGPTANFHIVSFDVTFQPFNACDGVGQKVAAIVKVCLTVSVFMGAFVVCIKNVSSAIGLQVRVSESVGRWDSV